MSKTLRNIALSCALAGLWCLGAAAQNSSSTTNANTSNESTSNTKLPAAEKMFLQKAGESDRAEVELGQLAEQKAESPQVKQFAQRMINDHTKNSDKVKEVAQQEGITIPDKISATDKAAKDRLEKLSGKEFDHAYMLDMLKDHEKDVREFRMESKDAKNPAVKNFAAQTLPVLESHLSEARSVEPQTARELHQTNTQTRASR